MDFVESARSESHGEPTIRKKREENRWANCAADERLPPGKSSSGFGEDNEMFGCNWMSDVWGYGNEDLWAPMSIPPSLCLMIVRRELQEEPLSGCRRMNTTVIGRSERGKSEDWERCPYLGYCLLYRTFSNCLLRMEWSSKYTWSDRRSHEKKDKRREKDVEVHWGRSIRKVRRTHSSG